MWCNLYGFPIVFFFLQILCQSHYTIWKVPLNEHKYFHFAVDLFTELSSQRHGAILKDEFYLALVPNYPNESASKQNQVIAVSQYASKWYRSKIKQVLHLVKHGHMDEVISTTEINFLGLRPIEMTKELEANLNVCSKPSWAWKTSMVGCD